MSSTMDVNSDQNEFLDVFQEKEEDTVVDSNNSTFQEENEFSDVFEVKDDNSIEESKDDLEEEPKEDILSDTAKQAGYITLKGVKGIAQLPVKIPYGIFSLVGNGINSMKKAMGMKNTSDEEFEKVLENTPPGQLNKFFSETEVAKWFDKFEKEQPDQVQKVGDFIESVSGGAAFGPVGAAYATADWALKRALEESGNEEIAKWSPLLLMAYDAARAIKGKFSGRTSKIAKKTESGLSERKFRGKSTEELVKTKVSKSTKEKAWNEITEEAKTIVRGVEEESIPLSKANEDVGTLFDKADELFKETEKLSTGKDFQKPVVSVSGKDGINTFIDKSVNELTKDVLHQSPQTKEVVKTAREIKRDLLKGGKKISLRQSLKQYRENNKILKSEFSKKGGENFNQDKVDLLIGVNKQLEKHIIKNSPTGSDFGNTFKEGNKFYSTAKNIEKYDQIMTPILRDHPSVSEFGSVFKNSKKSAELKKIVGKDRYNRLKKLSDELKDFDVKLKKMGIGNEVLGKADLVTYAISPKLALARKVSEGMKSFFSNNLLNPEYEKRIISINNAVNSGDKARSIGLINSFQKQLEKDYNNSREYKKKLSGD